MLLRNNRTIKLRDWIVWGYVTRYYDTVNLSVGL